MSAILKGCYTAIVTPFGTEGKRWDHPINHLTLDRLLYHGIANGVDGFVVAGCTGSDAVLTTDEQVGLVRYVKRAVGDRAAVIAGDGSNCTREAIEMAKRMEGEAGVFLHLQVSPYKNKPSDIGMVEHFRAVADNIEGGVILYSVPGRTGGKGILPQTAEALCQHPRIYGIKEASGDISRISETIRLTKGKDPSFSVLSGDDGMTVPIMRAGGDGVISVASNICPKPVSLIVKCALEGDFAGAAAADECLRELYSALFPKSDCNPSPNPVMAHYALDRMGYSVGVPRLPMTESSKQEKAAMDKALRNLELISD